MTVKVLRDIQTNHGRLVATKRVWVAQNGHEVTVETDACVNSKATYGDRQYAYSRVFYKCECGREIMHRGAPKKSELNNHDSWVTPEQIMQTRLAIMEATK